MLSSFNVQGYSNITLYSSIPIYVRIEVAFSLTLTSSNIDIDIILLVLEIHYQTSVELERVLMRLRKEIGAKFSVCSSSTIMGA